MSIIQKIQDKGAWIISILIGIALIAFIMMDYSKHPTLFSNTNTIGKVNGSKIALDDFNKQVDDVSKMQGNQNAPREAVQENVWNYLVQTTLLKQAYDALGLTTTQKDISNALYGQNPPQELRQAFTNQQTGQYDPAAAANAISNITRRGTPQQKQAIEQLINQTTQQILFGKYQTLLAGAVNVPSWLAAKTLADNNAIAKVSYVEVPYSTVSDSAVKVSDDEINTYVSAHKKLFEQKDETRAISCVAFNAAPTATDSAAAKDPLVKLIPDFIASKDDSTFVASKEGIIPFPNEYISSQQMQTMQMPYAEALNTPVDSTFGPFVFNDNYILAKMIGKISMPDSVKVRHILVAINVPDQQTGQMTPLRSDSDALKRIDSALAAIKAGASFDSVALKYSDDKSSAVKGGVMDFFPSGRTVPQFNNFAFTKHKGETGIVKTMYGYHYIEILDQKGSTTGYNIASISRPINASSQTVDSVTNAAAAFVAASQNSKAFETNAKQKNMPVTPIPNLKANDYQVGNFGSSRELVKWAYDHKVGEVSQPFEVGSAVIVAALTADNKAGLPDANTVRQFVQPILANRKKAKIIIDSKLKGSDLQSYAQSSGDSIRIIDSLSFSSPFIPNVGNEPKFVGVAFNNSLLNKTSAPIAGNAGVFGIMPLQISAKSSLEGGPEEIKTMLKQNWIQQQERNFVNALQKAAKIEDNRSKFFLINLFGKMINKKIVKRIFYYLFYLNSISKII